MHTGLTHAPSTLTSDLQEGSLDMIQCIKLIFLVHAAIAPALLPVAAPEALLPISVPISTPAAALSGLPPVTAPVAVTTSVRSSTFFLHI